MAACNSGKKNNEAVRQGIVDHLAQRGLNVQGMDVAITNLEVKGDQADATVSITPKGGSPAQGMAMKYHLEQKDSKWTVTGRAGTNGHGTGAMPPAGSTGMENPHGGGMAPPAGAPPASGSMPSPESLPPAKKQ